MQRLIEQPSGTGELLVDRMPVARVHYALSVYRQFPEDGSAGGLTHLEVEGRIRALDDLDVAALGPVDVDFVLRLEDGRLLDFAFTTGDGAIHSTGRSLSGPSCTAASRPHRLAPRS
jgi:hypothetical protein